MEELELKIKERIKFLKNQIDEIKEDVDDSDDMELIESYETFIICYNSEIRFLQQLIKNAQ